MDRLFIAAVPEGLTENPELKRLMGKLKRTVESREHVVRWTPPKLWHVTLEFLGDLNVAQSEAAYRAFDTWSPTPGAVSLKLQNFGAFPEVEAARVLWIGVAENKAFIGLQEDLRKHLDAAGLPLGKHEFSPHVTLARFRQTHHVGDLVDLGGRKKFGEYAINQIALFKSVRQGNIVKYVKEKTRAL